MANICNLCGKAASLMCQRCNETYCSTNCQILDWRVHKKVCFQMPILVPIKEANSKAAAVAAIDHRSTNCETSRNRSSSESNKSTKRPRNPLKITSKEKLTFSQVSSKSAEINARIEFDFSLKPKQATPTKENEGFINSSVSQCSKTSMRNTAWRTPYRYPEGVFFDVVVQYVEEDNASGIVWVTELKYETPLRKLLAEINRNIDINTDHCSIEEIQVGSLIAAPFENLYYRAEIIEIIQISKMVVVHLIDYGNLIEVPFNDLRSAIPIMRNLNAYAFRIHYSKQIPLEAVLSIRVLGVDSNGVAKIEENATTKATPVGISAELFVTSPTATLVKISDSGKYSLLCLTNEHVTNQLQEMNKFLNSDASSQLHLEKPPKDGEFVAARTLNGWYRALVMNTYRNDYLVYLFDIGRIALVEQVLLVPEKFRSIPMQVFAVELLKVLTDGKNLMDCLFHDKAFILKANTSAKPQHNSRFPCFIVSTDGKKIAEIEAFNYFGKCDQVRVRDWVEPLISGSAVHITGVLSHSEIFISLLCTKLYPKIFSAAADDCELLSSGKYEKGDLVLAQAESEYFRARIIDADKSDTLKVLNVDTGLVLTVSSKTIRKANMFVLSCPYHTRKVKLLYLSNVQTPYADNKARSMLEQCQEKGAEFILKFDSNPEIGVELLLKNANQQSLNKQLLPMLFEKKPEIMHEEKNASVVEKPMTPPSPEIIEHLKSKVYTMKDLEIIPITCGNNVPIMVLDTSTISKSYISGCDFTNKEFLKKLESEYLPKLANHCAKFSACSEYCPSVDEICLAVYDGDKDWYRAVCLNQIENDTFYVMFLDYGNMGRVHKSNIRKITEELMFPTNANMCIIEGLPEEVPQQLCEKFIFTTQADPKIYAKVTRLERDTYLIKIKNMEKYF